MDLLKNINNEIINSGYHIKNDGDFPSIKGFFTTLKAMLIKIFLFF